MKRMRLTIGALLVTVAVTAPTMAQADDGPSDPWRHSMLMDRTVTVDVGEIIPRLVTIEGRPNASDDRTFDILITVADRQLPTVTVYTGGRVPPFQRHIGGIGLVATSVRVALEYRYDTRQYVCAAGLGNGCLARLPLDALNTAWLTQDGREAGLWVTVGLTANEVTTERRIGLPLVGQVIGMVS